MGAKNRGKRSNRNPEWEGLSSNRELSLKFRKRGKDWVAKHKGITYTVTGGPAHGEYRVLRDGHDWMERKFNSLDVATSVAADIAQATGGKSNKTILDAWAKENPTKKVRKNPEDDVALLSTGDVDPLTYGGGILYYQPQYNEFLWVFWREPEEEEEEIEDATYRVYQFRYDPDEDLFEDSLSWAKGDLDRLIRTGFSPISQKELRELGRAEPLSKWEAARIVRDYSGPENLDHEPFEQSHAQMEKAFGDAIDETANRSFKDAKTILQKALAESNPRTKRLANRMANGG